MIAFQTWLRRLGWLHPFRASDIDEAISENIKFDASKIEQYAVQATESAGRMVEASSKLRSSIASNVKSSFAEYEHLVHHGERRRASHR